MAYHFFTINFNKTITKFKPIMKHLFTLILLAISTTIFAQKSNKNNLILLENEQNILPILDLEKYEIAINNMSARMSVFNETLQLYKNIEKNEVEFLGNNQIDNFVNSVTNKIITAQSLKKIIKKDKTNYSNKIGIISYFPNEKNDNYLQYLQFFDTTLVDKKLPVIFVHFGTPETLPNIENLSSIKAILIANDSTASSQNLAAQAIFGAIVPQGKLSQNLRNYPQNYALNMPQLSRLQYVMPENMGLKTEKLSSLDSLINHALQQKAMPGCQVLVAKNGKVFYHKAFGYHSYDSTQKVNLTDVYDLASITKIAAGTLAVMKLTEDKKLNLDNKLSDYLTEFKKTNKKAIILREMYAHQAQLAAGVATWHTMKSSLFTRTTNNSSNKNLNTIFSVAVTDSLYTKPEVFNLILQNIKNTPLLPAKQYLYSDLPFVLTTFLVKKVVKQNLDVFLSQNFYKSLGANLVFNPLKQYNKTQIIPTEYDSAFRKQQIHGTVHDEIAALLGGVSAHAGLFGSANDLAKLMQMYLQKGEYGGKTYIKSETITEFSRSQYLWENLGNYRGIGFNRPAMNPTPTGHTATSVSQQSYGHSGFTGTYTWVDSENGLLYVFLSNRVYPTRANQELMNLNLRTKILDKVYELFAEIENK